MANFEQLLIEKIEYLLALEVGDVSRLKNIEKNIIDNKKLYNSDILYVEELIQKNPSKLTERFEDNSLVKNYNQCWKCFEEIETSAKYCSFCGTDQSQKKMNSDEISSKELNQAKNPLKIISNFHPYQILAIIGALAALIPIMIGVSSLERVFELVEFYTDRDLSSFYLAFISFGIISGILCLLVIAISFRIKNPRKVGKFLIYLSVGILIFSILSGVVGFVIILFGGILALKNTE